MATSSCYSQSQHTISFAQPMKSGMESSFSSLGDQTCCSKQSSRGNSLKQSSRGSKNCSRSNSNLSQSTKSCATSKRTKFSQKLSHVDESDECPTDNPDANCSKDFTLSGSKPTKTVGALSKCFDSFAKYAPCGHWKSCKTNACDQRNFFDSCKSCGSRAPFGPYGPWSKGGPSKFCSPKEEYLKYVLPVTKKKRNGLASRRSQPMGKLAPWPLSGSCRYAGRPYGPCRPFGAYKSRGPFGYWTCKSWPVFLRPSTPVQPCYKPSKAGRRPCTPCHRPLFRPCHPCLPCQM